MRWDNLFDDLEGQLEQELDTERGDLLAEEERLRLGRLALRDRLAAMTRGGGESARLSLVLRDGSDLNVEVGSLGRDWVAGESVGERRLRASCVVPFSAVACVVPRGDQLAASVGAATLGTPAAQGAPGSGLSARLGLAFVLRDLCRRRASVDLVCSWASLHGTIDRVGRDHLDLAEHDHGEARRDSAVRRTRLIPFSELLVVRF